MCSFPPTLMVSLGNGPTEKKKITLKQSSKSCTCSFNLRAINTDFQHKGHKLATTFSRPNKDCRLNPGLTGKNIKVKYKGNNHKGKILGPTETSAAAVSSSPPGPSFWNVKFEDGYVTSMSKCRIKKPLLNLEHQKTHRPRNS